MTYRSGTTKIDDEAVDGLLGTNNSLAYKVHEIEKHFHNHEDWFGLAATPVAETHRADALSTGTVAPFQIDAGSDTWGAWVQILGSTDTPHRSGMVKFDMHKLQVSDAEKTDIPIFIQISAGATGDAGVAALDYTTIAYQTAVTKAGEGAVSFMQSRLAVGTKVWARCIAIGTDTMTLDFYFGLHEYAG